MPAIDAIRIIEALVMMFDESTVTAPRGHAQAPLPRGTLGMAARRAPASALVLFVGAHTRPSAEDCQSLGRDGMRCLWLPGPTQAIEAARQARFDSVVIDTRALEGHEAALLARLRDAIGCPLVLLADVHDEVDEIVALEMGADVYLTRPVTARRLRAQLAALLRLRQGMRTHAHGDHMAPTASMAQASWTLDRVTNRLCRGDQAVGLTEVQTALLQCLLEAAGRIVPRERLIAALPLGQAVTARSVDVYIHRLRKRLAEAGVLELVIEAIRGRGYVLHPSL